MEGIIIAIIIGVITSIYTKGKKPRKSQANPFSIGKSDFQEMYRKLRESTTANSLAAADTKVTVKQSKHVEKIDTPMSSMSVSTKPVPGGQISRIQNQDKQPKEVEYKHNLEEDVPNEQFVNAVIWSEILGPPRAKRPYSLSRK